MKPGVGERVYHARLGEGVASSHASADWTFVRFGRRGAALLCSNNALTAVTHAPVNDDGVEYCGWTTEAGTFGGCGHLWPCPTVAAGRRP